MINRGSRSTPQKRLVLYSCLFVPVLVLCLGSASAGVTELRMEIQDLSNKGSPIQISGYMILRYDRANQFPFSYEQSTSVKNVSTKSILLMIVRLEASSGPGRDEKYSQEYFFADPLGTGQVEISHGPEQRFGTSLINGEPLPYKKDPHPAAQAHAEFVQFSDGSTWGDADSAADALDARRKIVEELDLLEHLYEQAGEAAFLDQFARADVVPDVIRQMRDRCGEKTADSKCPYSVVHRTFLIAKEHQAAINPDVALEKH
jgi:hypothetical protein